MSLPADFDQTLAEVTKLGIRDEPPGPIRDRLVLAVRTAVQQDGTAVKDLGAQDLGLLDWSTKILHKCGDAIHAELCDPQKGGLKDQYKDLITKASSDDAIRTIAGEA